MSNSKKKGRKAATNNSLTDEDILKYGPLVTSIALYFFRLNRDKKLEWVDVYQTAWVGFLKAARRYKSNLGVTLGAYARTWVWGAVYRSILGSRAKTNARLQIGFPVQNVQINTDFQADIDLVDYIINQPQPMRDIIKLSSMGYKPKEISVALLIPVSEINRAHLEFQESLGHLVS